MESMEMLSPGWWTFELMQTAGGNYYVRFQPSSWRDARGDLVAFIHTRMVRDKRGQLRQPRIEFMVENLASYTNDDLPLGRNPTVLRVVRRYLEKKYPDYTVVS